MDSNLDNQTPEKANLNDEGPGISELTKTAMKILRLGPICDSCLGRQFARLSTGLTNKERGHAIKTTLAMAADLLPEEAKQSLLADLAPTFRPARLRLGKVDQDERCWVCLGLMERERLEELAGKAVAATRFHEHSTFLMGTRMSGLLAENEELLLADGGSSYAEPLKSELNREVGKLVASMTGKQADLKNPDLVVHINLEKGEAELQVSSLYIYGRYRKLKRGFPQTRWPCRECGGAGCPRCGQTGRMYQESVDELIRDPVIEATRAEDTVFHGAGREDIDALMLGTGRPFVVEARMPMKRSVDLVKLKEEINRAASGKVEVSDLFLVSGSKVEELKDAAFEKTYDALVEFEQAVEEEKLKSVLKELVGSVEQRTPTRVAHRRADKIRKRQVHSLHLTEFTERSARITVKCDGGLYIKELISGDLGRTKPSLSEGLGVKAVVAALDVINVGGESDGQVTWGP
jgi:tRNA pseudouridine synthase 10